MPFPPGFIEELKARNPIEQVISRYVELKRAGSNLVGLCPFHSERSPSFTVFKDNFHCFGCSAGGDVITFVMRMENLEYPDAIRFLADRCGMTVPENETGVFRKKSALTRERSFAMNKLAARHFYENLNTPEGAAAREYLMEKRKLTRATCIRFGLGYAKNSFNDLTDLLVSQGYTPEEIKENFLCGFSQKNGRPFDMFRNRVMFPIIDTTGNIIAFGGRVIGTGEPKYLNSQETPLFHKSRVLYGLDKAKASLTSTGIALITEGYTDVIALHESGITNAVATLGTSLTMNHIRLISRYAQHKIVYLFDGDAAGQKAADRALQFIDESMTPEAGRSKIELCAVTLPDNQDPAEYMASHSADDLRQLVHDAKPLIEYGIERRLAKHDLSSAEGRTAALTDALSILAPIKNSLLAKDYAVQIAGRVRAREDDVLTRLSQLKAPRRFDEDDAPQSGLRGSLTSQQVIPKAPAHPSLSSAEVNRRRFEGELLGLCAQNPLLALAHADSLAQTQWHEDVHSRLAFAMLDSLAANPAITPAELVSRISTDIPLASRILTTSRSASDDEETMATYLIEELSIGDMEDSISQLRMTLSANDGLDAEEREILFQSIVSMQKTLTDKKRAHKAPVFYE